MADVIAGPGFYRQRDGGKVEIVAVARGVGIGYAPNFESWEPDTWQLDGSWYEDGGEDARDIVSVWHEPPVPPEGFELRDRETYRAVEGDMFFGSNGERKWCPCCATRGSTASEMDDMSPHQAPFYIASPIKPAEPVTWTPTCELRDRDLGMRSSFTIPESGASIRVIDDEWHAVLREQKWTSSDGRSEWRPIPVEVTHDA